MTTSPDRYAYVPTVAKRLAVGDTFVPDGSLDDAQEHGWYWTVVEHSFTVAGDYSTVVRCEDTEWTERYVPEDPVHLVEVLAATAPADAAH